MGDAATAERWAIRIVVLAALLCAAFAAILLPHAQPLPAVALGSRWILYALRALVLFYGFLLLFVPLVRALHGVLPIELSLRGARWQEADAAAEGFKTLDKRSGVVEEQIEELWEAVGSALSRIAAIETRDSPAVTQRPPPSGGS